MGIAPNKTIVYANKYHLNTGENWAILASMKIIEKSRNQVGTLYGLSLSHDGKYGVWVLRHNYAGHVRGGIIATWRYCLLGAEESEARKIFSKKLKGKVKA